MGLAKKYKKLYVIELANDTYYISKFKNKNSILEMEFSFACTHKELSTLKLNPNLPILVCINNNAILSKKCLPSETVNQVFENIKLSDFYYESVETKTEKHIYIIRKNTFEETLKLLEQCGIKNSIDVHFGNSKMYSIQQFINRNSLQIHNKTFRYSTETTEETPLTSYKINDIEFTQYNINAFACVYNYYAENLVKENNTFKEVHRLKNIFLNNYIFKRVSRGSMLVFLFALALNSIFYFNLLNEKNILSQEIVNAELQMKNSKKLKKQIVIKKDFVAVLKQNRNLQTSRIIDEIMATVPRKIQLNFLKIQPLQQRIKPLKKVLVSENQLLINGRTTSDKDFNLWLKKLETIQVIENINLVSFSEKNNHLADFTVDLKFKFYEDSH